MSLTQPAALLTDTHFGQAVPDHVPTSRPSAPEAAKNYSPISRIYESLGQIYSGGQIFAAKASQIAEMKLGDRVLYAGVGPGEDAVLAAQAGANVTCLDLAAGMLRVAQTKLDQAGVKAELIQGDILAHDRVEQYDVVIANFFLNVFPEAVVIQMLKHLATLVKPGGKLLISDFMKPEGGVLSRSSQACYWGVTNLFYWLLGLSAWHPVYDYPAYFATAGLELEREDRFRLFNRLPLGFWSVTARLSSK